MASPITDKVIHNIHICRSISHGRKSWILQRNVVIHGCTQVSPVTFAYTDNGDMTICGGINIIRGKRFAGMTITRTWLLFSSNIVRTQRGRQRRHDTILHGYINRGAFTGLRPPEQG